MLPPPIPSDEVERLACLESYAILDTPPESDFDDLTLLASRICQTPASLITLVARDRQWFKSHLGTELTELPRAIAFCSHTIMGTGVLEIPNTATDPRFADSPLVTSDPNVRFYAGSPLITPEGRAIGSICVLDLVPRKLDPDQVGALQSLGRQVVSQMRLRKDARSLAVSEKYQRSTIDAIMACVCTLDETGRVLSVNRAWRDANLGTGFLAGLTAGENYQDKAGPMLEPETPVDLAIATALERVRSGAVPEFEQEYLYRSPTGDRWLRIKAARFEAGGKHRLAVVHEDVTERRRAVAYQLERRSLKEAVRSMEQVLGVVGHELRTPLAGLRAMTDFVLDPAARGTHDFEPFLRSIGDEVLRMSDTVDTLLEAARINSGRASWNWSTVDVPSVCNHVLGQFAPIGLHNGVKLKAEVDPAVGPIRGDAGGIHRLLTNLVGNARKHTVAGSIRITARPIELDGQPGIELAVADTGPGIAPEILCKLGEAFALNSGVVGDHFVSGTGLGLSICKGIAAAHAGRILVESTAGIGTTVRVLIRSDLEAPSEQPADNLFTGSLKLAVAA